MQLRFRFIFVFFPFAFIFAHFLSCFVSSSQFAFVSFRFEFNSFRFQSISSHLPSVRIRRFSNSCQHKSFLNFYPKPKKESPNFFASHCFVFFVVTIFFGWAFIFFFFRSLTINFWQDICFYFLTNF